jgi:hypothetical protein
MIWHVAGVVPGQPHVRLDRVVVEAPLEVARRPPGVLGDVRHVRLDAQPGSLLPAPAPSLLGVAVGLPTGRIPFLGEAWPPVWAMVAAVGWPAFGQSSPSSARRRGVSRGPAARADLDAASGPVETNTCGVARLGNRGTACGLARGRRSTSHSPTRPPFGEPVLRSSPTPGVANQDPRPFAGRPRWRVRAGHDRCPWRQRTIRPASCQSPAGSRCRPAIPRLSRASAHRGRPTDVGAAARRAGRGPSAAGHVHGGRRRGARRRPLERRGRPGRAADRGRLRRRRRAARSASAAASRSRRPHLEAPGRIIPV